MERESQLKSASAEQTVEKGDVYKRQMERSAIMEIRTIKEQICDVCHKMWQLGWVAANDGNVSAKRCV